MWILTWYYRNIFLKVYRIIIRKKNIDLLVEYRWDVFESWVLCGRRLHSTSFWVIQHKKSGRIGEIIQIRITTDLRHFVDRLSLTNILGNRIAWGKIFFPCEGGTATPIPAAYALSGAKHPLYQGGMRPRIPPRCALWTSFIRDDDDDLSSSFDKARQRPVTRQESGARSIRATRKL